MSIYYFIKQQFPVKEKRVELRSIFDEHGRIPDEILHNDEYFHKFNLYLPERLPDRVNKYDGLNYATLADSRNQLDLRPIRNVIVKQNSPPGDDSSIYEIFNRLNSGGVNLTPQEIRASLYHSDFFDALRRLNTLAAWRRFIPSPGPDLHMKDIEILLPRLRNAHGIRPLFPSLTKFLNEFSTECRPHTPEQNAYLERLFNSFLQAGAALPDDTFLNKRNGKFNVALFEAVFTAASATALRERRTLDGQLAYEAITALESRPEFIAASLQGTTKTANVRTRLGLAREMIPSL